MSMVIYILIPLCISNIIWVAVGIKVNITIREEVRIARGNLCNKYDERVFK